MLSVTKAKLVKYISNNRLLEIQYQSPSNNHNAENNSFNVLPRLQCLG